jgi:hypothetical protein
MKTFSIKKFSEDKNLTPDQKWNVLRNKFNKASNAKLRKKSEDGDKWEIAILKDGKETSSIKVMMSQPIEKLAKDLATKLHVDVPKVGEITQGPEQRRKAVEKILKGKKYPDFIKTLEEMCKDRKAKDLLGEVFGGPLGDDLLEVSDADIPASKLNPTQNEIDLDKSLKYGLTDVKNVKAYFQPEVELGSPLITYNGNFVIDGHHRWSQTFIFNPEAVMSCINYEGDLSAMQMLKSTQASIAAASGQVPQSTVDGTNMFDVTEDTLSKYIDSKITDEVVEELGNHVSSVKDKASAIKYLVANCMKLITDHTPITNAPTRDLMPQTDKAPQALKKLEDSTIALSEHEYVITYIEPKNGPTDSMEEIIKARNLAHALKLARQKFAKKYIIVNITAK